MQNTYQTQDQRAMPLGALADSNLGDVRSAINASPGAAQVDTMTILNFVAGKVYQWTIDGIPFSYTTLAADVNVTGVAVAIVAQVNSEPLFSGRFRATNVAGVISFTARFPGVGWTLLATGANAADNAIGNSVANATGAVLPFGRLVVGDGQVSTTTGENKVKLATAANLTAKVVTGAPANVNTTVYTVAVTVKGVTYNAETTSGGAATVKEIVEALAPILNAMLPAQTVVVTEDDAKLIFTAELAGLDFSVAFGSSGATALWTVTDTGLVTDDVNKAAIGVSLRSDSREINSTTEPGYPANSGCSILRDGRIVVATESQIVANGQVYVRLATATTYPLGGFDDGAGTDKVLLDPNRFRWERALSSTRAILRVKSV